MTVGLTGGIGAGKSTVARVFSVLGVPVFDSDSEAKRMLELDPDVRRQVVELFGERAYSEGLPNRSYLARAIFGDASKREAMNAIVHPAVRKSFGHFAKEYVKAPYVINEAAILIETGAFRDMDATVLVVAPKKVRIDRVVKRDHASPVDVSQRMEAQWNDEEKRPYADFVLKNDGEHPLLPAVIKIHQTLLREAEGKSVPN